MRVISHIELGSSNPCMLGEEEATPQGCTGILQACKHIAILHKWVLGKESGTGFRLGGGVSEQQLDSPLCPETSLSLPAS